MKLKSKVKCKGKYKGNIDGQVKEVSAGDEFLCDPWLAYKLIAHYPAIFEIIGSESVGELPKKKFEVEQNKILADYESK
jgi:hypothetical protein